MHAEGSPGCCGLTAAIPQPLQKFGTTCCSRRDNLLMYKWEMCAIRQKVGSVTPRVSTNTNTPTAAKTTTPVPMDVSQMSSNVSKAETEELESESYLYEQDQDCDGDELFEGRSTLAERKMEKEARETGREKKVDPKEKGWSKGKWSNPRHTWDSSFYNSHWHGKTYGLEVDPWSAVEPVPYLCAASLSSSCEEFLNRNACRKEHSSKRCSLGARGISLT